LKSEEKIDEFRNFVGIVQLFFLGLSQFFLQFFNINEEIQLFFRNKVWVFRGLNLLVKVAKLVLFLPLPVLLFKLV
jgi:hypothetical protein